MLQLRDIFQERHVELRHGVQAKQIQARHAEMRAFDRPIVQPGDAQCATIAHTAGENFVSVREIIAILPDDLQHVAEMLRFRLAEAEWNHISQLAAPGLLNAM